MKNAFCFLLCLALTGSLAAAQGSSHAGAASSSPHSATTDSSPAESSTTSGSSTQASSQQSAPAASVKPGAKAPVDKSKRPSPPGTAEIKLGSGSVKIDYSRPYMKGRKIYGELVPYGKVWRTGANEATSLVTTVDLNIGGTDVPKGSSTLYTLPAEDGWKLIINKQTGQWGTVYDEKQDLARIPMKTSTLDAPVEQFTISFAMKGDKNSADLNLDWEKTRATVNVTAK